MGVNPANTGCRQGITDDSSRTQHAEISLDFGGGRLETEKEQWLIPLTGADTAANK